MPASQHSGHTGFFESLSPGKQHFTALLVLLIVPFFMFSSTTLGDKQIIGSDTIQYSAGVKSVNDYRAAHPEKEGIWLPNMFAGMPAYVVTKPTPVFNIDTVFNSISSFLYPVIYFWILLGGAYFFFILLKINPVPAALGAIFIAFTTYIPVIIEAGHVTKFRAYAYIPWVLAGYYLLTTSKKKILPFFIFALSLALTARADHPQVLYYFLYVLVIWWGFDTYKAWKEQKIKAWAVITLLIGLAGLTAVLSNLQNYWMLYEYSRHSTRGGSALEAAGSTGLSMDYAFAWSQGWGELWTLLVPGLFGGSSGEAYWGPKPFTSGPHYLGAIAFLLALFGLLKSKNKLKYIFLSTGILTALFSLGKFFPLLNQPMFNYMPMFSKFRTPEMWLIVTVVSFSILAVLGLQELLAAAQKKGKHVKDLYLPLGIAVALALIFMAGSTKFLSFEKPGELEAIAEQNQVSADNPQIRTQIQQVIDTRLKPERIEIAKTDSIRFAVFIFLGGILIVAFYTNKLNREFFLAGIFILGAYDMISIANRYLDKERFASKSADAQTIILQQKTAADDYITEHINSDEGWPYRVLPLADNPFNNAVPAYFYPSLGGYTAAKLSYYQDLVDELLFAGEYGISEPVLNMLNTKFIKINQQVSMPFLEQVFRDGNTFVYENTRVLPKAFFAGSIITVSSPKAAVEAMKNKNTFSADVRNAVVETEQQIATVYDSSAAVSVTHYDVQHLRLETESAEPQFLVLSEIYYPEGWKAFVDGEETPIYKTNYVLRGIEVPAGNHKIEFIFEPVSVIWGRRAALAGHLLLFGIGVFGCVTLYRGKNSTTGSETGNKTTK